MRKLIIVAVLAAIAALVFASAAIAGTPAIVQTAKRICLTAPSDAMTFSQPVAAGDTLAIVIAGQGYGSTSPVVTGVSDPVDGAWTDLNNTGAVTLDHTRYLSYSVYETTVAANAPSLTVSIAEQQGQSAASAVAVEVNAPLGASAFTAVRRGSLTAPTASAGALSIGLFGVYQYGQALGPGAGWTLDGLAHNCTAALAESAVPSSDSAPTVASSGLYAAGTLTFGKVSPPPPPPPVPPKNTAKPTISGTAQQGDTLTASSGTWTGDMPMTFAYNWSDGTTGKTDTLPAADVGQTVSVTVTASNDGGNATATSDSVGPVTSPPPPPPPPSGLLPGEVIWPSGASNLLFGTNDTGEWGAPNIECQNSLDAPCTPNTAVQTDMKDAGFQLDRVFISHNDMAHGNEMTDAEIAARVNTAANIGAQCMADFPATSTSSIPSSGDTMTDLQFAEHVAMLTDGTHAGYAKCSMFEIGNEADCGGGPFSNGVYAAEWNQYVSALRALRPDAAFLGPVECNGVNEMLWFLQQIVANHYQVPDAIDFHWYPCNNAGSWSNCLISSTVAQIGQDAQTVRSDLQQTLGYQLPIGISEWSADSACNGPTNLKRQDSSGQFDQFLTASLDAMAQANLAFAAEFDAQSGAGCGGLDMFDTNDQPYPYFNAYTNEIAKYKGP